MTPAQETPVAAPILAEGSTSMPVVAIDGEIVAAPRARRMTSQPPRFTTTTPGVMRRQPR